MVLGKSMAHSVAKQTISDEFAHLRNRTLRRRPTKRAAAFRDAVRMINRLNPIGIFREGKQDGKDKSAIFQAVVVTSAEEGTLAVVVVTVAGRDPHIIDSEPLMVLRAHCVARVMQTFSQTIDVALHMLLPQLIELGHNWRGMDDGVYAMVGEKGVFIFRLEAGDTNGITAISFDSMTPIQADKLKPSIDTIIPWRDTK